MGYSHDPSQRFAPSPEQMCIHRYDSKVGQTLGWTVHVVVFAFLLLFSLHLIHINMN